MIICTVFVCVKNIYSVYLSALQQCYYVQLQTVYDFSFFCARPVNVHVIAASLASSKHSLHNYDYFFQFFFVQDWRSAVSARTVLFLIVDVCVIMIYMLVSTCAEYFYQHCAASLRARANQDSMKNLSAHNNRIIFQLLNACPLFI